jgi:hypothetical protein
MRKAVGNAKRRRKVVVLASLLFVLTLLAGASAQQGGQAGQSAQGEASSNCESVTCFEVSHVASCQGDNCLEALATEDCEEPPCFALKQVEKCEGDRCFQVLSVPKRNPLMVARVARPIKGVPTPTPGQNLEPLPNRTVVRPVEKAAECRAGNCFEMKQVKDCKKPPCFAAIKKEKCEGSGCFALKKL